MFKITHTENKARRGQLTLPHGTVETPVFMPIATKAAVKYIGNDDFMAINNQMVLTNTYHLYLRPGLDVLKECGGAHALMNWNKPMLTDSGGFQVFSLAKLRTLSDDSVTFNSHIDGRELVFTPELSMDIQSVIGADIRMCFDYFPGYPATREDAERSVKLTTTWAQRCKNHFSTSLNDTDLQQPKLFGIVQGSSFKDLRVKSAAELVSISFDGYAIGGLAVGEPSEVMYEMLEVTVPELPEDKPHYLMGVGQPEQILEAVKRGVDMFDCVLPTRNARHGQVYMHKPGMAGKIIEPDLSAAHYDKLTIKSAIHSTDNNPLDNLCQCHTCSSGYSRAYIRHLFTVDEALAKQLTTVHNLSFYMQLMQEIREAIVNMRTNGKNILYPSN